MRALRCTGWCKFWVNTTSVGGANMVVDGDANGNDIIRQGLLCRKMVKSSGHHLPATGAKRRSRLDRSSVRRMSKLVHQSFRGMPRDFPSGIKWVWWLFSTMSFFAFTLHCRLKMVQLWGHLFSICWHLFSHQVAKPDQMVLMPVLPSAQKIAFVHMCLPQNLFDHWCKIVAATKCSHKKPSNVNPLPHVSMHHCSTIECVAMSFIFVIFGTHFEHFAIARPLPFCPKLAGNLVNSCHCSIVPNVSNWLGDFGTLENKASTVCHFEKVLESCCIGNFSVWQMECHLEGVVHLSGTSENAKVSTKSNLWKTLKVANKSLWSLWKVWKVLACTFWDFVFHFCPAQFQLRCFCWKGSKMHHDMIWV